MLIRSHDADASETRWRDFLAAQGFGHFVAAGLGHDVALVVPTQYVVVGDFVVLHLAASNPVFDRLSENAKAVLSVAGDWAYIPAAWKAIGDEDPRRGVPTTYYAAVQVAGAVKIVDDANELAAILGIQLGALEPGSDVIPPIEHKKRFPSIRGIRLSVDDVRAKFKYGGNVDLAHRQAIDARLEQRDAPGDAAARLHIPLNPRP